jgi:hypothetical protein
MNYKIDHFQMEMIISYLICKQFCRSNGFYKIIIIPNHLVFIELDNSSIFKQFGIIRASFLKNECVH